MYITNPVAAQYSQVYAQCCQPCWKFQCVDGVYTNRYLWQRCQCTSQTQHALPTRI